MRVPLPEISINRPVTVIMIAVSLLVLGYVSWNRIPLKFLPKVDRPFIGCFIPYPGGSPEQVEQQIAIPVEGEFRTIPGLRSISSVSSPNGCTVNLWFDLNTDMTIATADVRDRIERLKLVLPQEVEKILIQRFSSESIPVIAIGLFKAGDEENYIYSVRTSLVPRLKRLEGVADIRLISPIPEKEVLIEVSQNTLNSLNLPIISILNSLRSSSISMSVGTITEDYTKYFIKVNSEFKSLSDIENIIVTKDGLRLKDIATVKFGSREESQRVSLDGKGGVVLLIIKESEANAVEVCNSVKEELEKILSEETFQGTITKIFFDQSDLINRALRNLFSEGIYGGIMAFTVLLLFLHRLIPTLIVSFAIPSSLMIGIIFMYFSGMSLNIITMVSLIISVGMLVDNAIVVVENIIRYQQLGYDRRTSAIRGASDVGMAITASTITTVVVFLPMYYLEVGRMSVFMKQLGGPLIVSLLGSLGLALTIVPLILSHEELSDKTIKKTGRLSSEFRKMTNSISEFFGRYKLLEKMQNILSLSLRWSLENRVSFLLLLSLFLLISYLIPIQSVGMKDLIKLDTREIDIKVKLDQNFDRTKVRDLFDQFAQNLEVLREKLGIKNILLFHGNNGGEIHVYLYTEDDGDIGKNPPCTTEEAFDIIKKTLPKYIPGGSLEFTIADTGESGTLREVSLRLTGTDNNVLYDLSQLTKEQLLKDPIFSDVRVDVEQKKEELRVNINETFAQEQGVNPLVIAQTIDTALRGAQIPYMKEKSREIPVWLQFEEKDRQSKANLDNLLVLSNRGGLVPISQLTEYDRKPGPEIIKRYNGRNVINLYAKANTEDLMLIKSRIQNIIDKIDLPYGYTLNYGIELEEIQTNLANFFFTMSMAIILIYIVMAGSFESFLLPIIILTVVPLSLVGSAWTLFFLKAHWDMITLIGCVLMAGVIVNNGIVIVDHINLLRKQNPSIPRLDIIIQASKDRLRPVLMTALTTILGLVPLATAKSGGAVIFSGLGKALVGGLSLGTLLTLIVIPVFYTIVDDIENFILELVYSLKHLKHSKSIVDEKFETVPK